MPTAIVIGASSGIGLELTRQLATRGFRVACTARRLDLLERETAALPEVCRRQRMDVASVEEAREIFQNLARELGPVDQVYLCAGVGEINRELAWAPENETIRVNVLGFAALAAEAMSLFLRQKSGHLVGLSSIAALMGSGDAPAYNASKAFVSNYLAGLRSRARATGEPIFVTDILPGFVNTAMMKADKPFWVASPQKAAAQILQAVDRRAPRAYITRRWALLAAVLRVLPFG